MRSGGLPGPSGTTPKRTEAHGRRVPAGASAAVSVISLVNEAGYVVSYSFRLCNLTDVVFRHCRVGHACCVVGDSRGRVEARAVEYAAETHNHQLCVT
ncbi:hypothetical protein GCM10027563_08410 [Parasphingorhabdus pacifica]